MVIRSLCLNGFHGFINDIWGILGRRNIMPLQENLFMKNLCFLFILHLE